MKQSKTVKAKKMKPKPATSNMGAMKLKKGKSTTDSNKSDLSKHNMGQC